MTLWSDPAAYIAAPECRFEASGPETIISTENITDRFMDLVENAIETRDKLDCSWRITVQEDRAVRTLRPKTDTLYIHGRVQR